MIITRWIIRGAKEVLFRRCRGPISDKLSDNRSNSFRDLKWTKRNYISFIFWDNYFTNWKSYIIDWHSRVYNRLYKFVCNIKDKTRVSLSSHGFPYVSMGRPLVKSAPCKIALSINDPTASGPSSRPSTNSTVRDGEAAERTGQEKEKGERDNAPPRFLVSICRNESRDTGVGSISRISPNYIGPRETRTRAQIYMYIPTYPLGARVILAPTFVRRAACGSLQLLPDAAKANPVSLNDFCLENVGCPPPPAPLGEPPAPIRHRRCWARPNRSLENDALSSRRKLFPVNRHLVPYSDVSSFREKEKERAESRRKKRVRYDSHSK